MTENTTDQQLVALTCPRCMHCGNTAEVTMTRAQADALDMRQRRPSNAKIQHIFPDWPADQRELLISGTHPACWTAMFGEDEDEADTEPAPVEGGTGYLLIPCDGPTTIVEHTDTASTLAKLQAAVDGYVECIDLGDATTNAEGVDMWVNEEGKMRSDFGHNIRAQVLWDARYGRNTDVILGPVILTRHDDEGETTPLTEDDITEVRASFDMLGLEV